jgi:hypothetical protein
VSAPLARTGLEKREGTPQCQPKRGMLEDRGCVREPPALRVYLAILERARPFREWTLE